MGVDFAQYEKATQYSKKSELSDNSKTDLSSRTDDYSESSYSKLPDDVSKPLGRKPKK